MKLHNLGLPNSRTSPSFISLHKKWLCFLWCNSHPAPPKKIVTFQNTHQQTLGYPKFTPNDQLRAAIEGLMSRLMFPPRGIRIPDAGGMVFLDASTPRCRLHDLFRFQGDPAATTSATVWIRFWTRNRLSAHSHATCCNGILKVQILQIEPIHQVS